MNFDNFTLLVTCFNKQDYIPEFCENVVPFLAGGANVVIVDDGSSDNSVQLLKNINAKYENCLLLQTTNCGSAAARNLSLEQLRTEFFMFWDIDDGLDADSVSTILEEFKQSKADFAVANYVTMPENNSGQMPKEFKAFTLLNIASISEEVLLAMGYWRYVYRKSVVRNELSMRFIPTRDELNNSGFILDDLFWVLELALQRKILLITPPEIVTYRYRTHSTQDSLAWERFENQVIDLPYALVVFDAYLRDKNLINRKVQIKLYSSTLKKHYLYLSLFKKLKFFVNVSRASISSLNLAITYTTILPSLIVGLVFAWMRSLRSTARGIAKDASH